MATQRLKEYLVKGYSINQDRLAQNAEELKTSALRLVEKAASSKPLNGRCRAMFSGKIVSRYTQTFYGFNAMMKVCLMNPQGRKEACSTAGGDARH